MKTNFKFLLIVLILFTIHNISYSQWNYNYFKTNNCILKRVDDFTLFENQIYIYGVIEKLDSGEVKGIESIFKFQDSTWIEVLDSNNLGINGIVSQMFTYNNEIYFAGIFTQNNDSNYYSLAKYENTNFKIFNEFKTTNTNPIMINDVLNIDSSIVLSGNFLTIGDSIVNNLVKFDGTNWKSIYNGIDGEVTNLTNFNDTLYCSVLKNDTTFVYKSNNNSWVKLDYKIKGEIYDLFINDSLLYIVGNYEVDSLENSKKFNVRNLNSDQWITNLNNLNYSAYAVCKYDSDMYIIGEFNLNDTISIPPICKINNFIIEQFGSMEGSPVIIKSFDSLMVVSGYFSSIDSIYCPIIGLYGNPPIQSSVNINNNYSLNLNSIDLKVYPNPINDKLIFDIYIPNDGIYSFDIVSITGEVIFNNLNVNYKKGKHTININENDINFNNSKILYLRIGNNHESKAIRIER